MPVVDGDERKPYDSNFSAEDFAAKLEAGDFDGRVSEETKKLSHEQLLEVANISMRLRKAKSDKAYLDRNHKNSK